MSLKLWGPWVGGGPGSGRTRHIEAKLLKLISFSFPASCSGGCRSHSTRYLTLHQWSEGAEKRRKKRGQHSSPGIEQLGRYGVRSASRGGAKKVKTLPLPPIAVPSRAQAPGGDSQDWFDYPAASWYLLLRSASRPAQPRSLAFALGHGLWHWH